MWIMIVNTNKHRYVAMHTMQELDSASTDDESQGNGYLDGPERLERPRPQKNLRLICASVAGMLLPLVTQIGHAH